MSPTIFGNITFLKTYYKAAFKLERAVLSKERSKEMEQPALEFLPFRKSTPILIRQL